MDGFWRWTAKNRLLAKILFGIFICGVYASLLYFLKVPVWIIVLLDLVLLFIIHASVDAAGGMLLKKTMPALENQCDPYPMLQEAREQMRYSYTKVMLQTLKLNCAAALRSAGETEDAWKLLDSIHIDQYPGTLPGIKVVYYNNLADMLTLRGNPEEAEIWTRKALQLYQDMPENSMKRKLHHMIQLLQAESCLRRGEYTQALEQAQSINFDSLRSRVELSLLQGRCLIALGDTNSAKDKLRFAAENGNKLFAAAQARQLLETLGE